jgi:hypothetical protein
MRYVVLLLLLAVGSALLYLARYRYQAVNLQLAQLQSVEGTVDSVAANGDLNLKYSVAGTPYEITRSVPVKFFPNIRAGERVTLLYPAARPDTARVRHWSVVYPDSAITGGFALVAFAIGIGGFVMMGGIPSMKDIGGGDQAYATVTPYKANPVATTLDRPIELHNARNEFFLSFVLAGAAFLASYLLYRNPDFLWTRYIGYPVAVAAALLGVGMIFAAFQNKSLRLRADNDAIQLTDNEGSTTIYWKDVAALKRQSVTRSTLHGGHYTRRRYSTETVGRYLQLLDASGKVLYEINENVPMEPVQDWVRFRAFIPGRTNLPVQEETYEPLR